MNNDNFFSKALSEAEKMRAKSVQSPVLKIKHANKTYEAKFDGAYWVVNINGLDVNFAANNKKYAKEIILEYLGR